MLDNKVTVNFSLPLCSALFDQNVTSLSWCPLIVTILQITGDINLQDDHNIILKDKNINTQKLYWVTNFGYKEETCKN